MKCLPDVKFENAEEKEKLRSEHCIICLMSVCSDDAKSPVKALYCLGKVK